ncbi:MAG: hypothetical protein ABH877_01135 [bacterium]
MAIRHLTEIRSRGEIGCRLPSAERAAITVMNAGVSCDRDGITYGPQMKVVEHRQPIADFGSLG